MWFVLLCLADPDPLPPLSDLERFTAGHVLASWQLNYCRRWKEIVTEAEHIHGYSDGRFLAWRAALDFDLHYWVIYADAAERDPFGLGEAWRRGRLADLKELIGPARYLDGWAPAWRTEPPPPPPPPKPVDAMNGAQLE